MAAPCDDAWRSMQELSGSGAAQAAGTDTHCHVCAAAASTHGPGIRGTGVPMTDTPRVALRGGWDPRQRARGCCRGGGVCGGSRRGTRDGTLPQASRRSILRTRSQSSTSRTGPLPTQKDLPANAQEESCSGSELNCAVN